MVWQTFFAQDDSTPLTRAFGDLVCFDEIRVAPGGALPGVEANTLTFTYVHAGALKRRSAGRSTLLRAGDFQRVARSETQEERNASRTLWSHVFRLCIRTGGASENEAADLYEQERFTLARRHNRLCVVGSPSGVSESLVLDSDTFIYSSVVDVGHHLVHALQPRRRAWLHVLRGEATVGDFELAAGDGIGVSDFAAVSLTARADSEILLVDMHAASARAG